MAMYEVGVTKMDPERGNQTVAIFRIFDDGKTEPILVNPPDPVTIAALRRALDLLDDQAAVAAGQKPASRSKT
jgi:hypothetical protein